jgi:hypothetical protein
LPEITEAKLLLNNPPAGERTPILADFVASCNGKIVEILTQILHFLKKELSRWAEEMS